MSKNSKDDGQFFVVFVGNKPSCDDEEGFANVLLGLVAIGIVMMLMVGLLNDAKRDRWQNTAQPNHFLNQRIDTIW